MTNTPFHSRLPRTLVLMTLIGSFLTPAFCDTALVQPRFAPSVMSSALTVVADDQTPIPGRRDFGSVSTANTPRLEHIFTVRNDTTIPLTITRLQPSCGCTSAVLVKSGSLPAILKPGQQIPIQVRINLEPYLSGSFRKTVSIFVAEQITPAAVLEMLATLNTLAVTATPKVLDFGQTPYGKEVRIPFRLSAKNGVTPVSLSASLACSNPDIALSLSPLSPKDEPGTLLGVATLSARAHLGPLGGQVMILSPNQDAVPLISLPIQGQVNGDITATPASLSWDTLAPNHSVSQRITLAARIPGALRGLRVTCASHSAVVHMEATSSLTTATLTVDLTPSAGRQVTTRIVVITASGQCLIIPVFTKSSVAASATTDTAPYKAAVLPGPAFSVGPFRAGLRGSALRRRVFL